MDTTKYRAPILLLSIGLAAGLFLLLGLQDPAVRLFHRWYSGLASLFILFFAVLALLGLRGTFSRALWIFPASIVLSYLAAIAAYTTYFLTFEYERAANAFKFGLADFAQILLFSATAALVWLFALLVAAIYWSLQRLLRVYAGQDRGRYSA